MATELNLRYHDSGYWGYLSEDVKYTISHKLDAFQIVDAGQLYLATNQLEVGIAGLGCLGNSDLSTLRLSGIPTYADDAAAATGGLAQNQVYKTPTGELRIKL